MLKGIIAMSIEILDISKKPFFNINQTIINHEK